MHDQANKLRQMAFTATSTSASSGDAAQLPIVVVSGARSGVGATTVAMNLAAALADRGERVLVVDAAHSGNDLAEVAGVGRELDYAVSDVVTGKCGVADAIISGPVGIRVLASRGRLSPRRDFESRTSTSSVRARDSSTRCFSRREQQRFLGELDAMRDEIDLVVIDAGCGLSAWTRRLWMRAQMVVLVTTTDDVALLDAYATIKQSSADGIGPAIRLLVNQADSDAAVGDACRRIMDSCRRFLSLSIEALPSLARCDGDAIAGEASAPRVWEIPNSTFGRGVLWLGRAVSDLLAAIDPRRSTDRDACADGRFPNSQILGQETRAQLATSGKQFVGV